MANASDVPPDAKISLANLPVFQEDSAANQSDDGVNQGVVREE
jgi:hypothetical protein